MPVADLNYISGRVVTDYMTAILCEESRSIATSRLVGGISPRKGAVDHRIDAFVCPSAAAHLTSDL